MKKYDDIVVGSGISGMTMALILGMNGRSVLLLEKNRHMGGSVARFSKKGIPFDIGFHFTGGLHKGGILDELLKALDIRNLIEPVFHSEEHANICVFEKEQDTYHVPLGIENLKQKLTSYFPDESSAVHRYFEKVEHVCSRTPSMDLRTFFTPNRYLEEDAVSLETELAGITQNTKLKTILSLFATCYGVKSEDISFADHSRICLGFYESIAHIKGGGASFIRAFEQKFRDHGIDVRCGDYITGITDIENKRAGRFILNSGEEISADRCVFTIHPGEILKTVPPHEFSRAFINRISSFEPSTGFFAVFCALDEGFEESGFDRTVFSVLPGDDINALLGSPGRNEAALLLIRSVEEVNGRERKTIVALEPSAQTETEPWKDSLTGRRDGDYQDYKERKTGSIMSRIYRLFPQYKGHLQILDSSSLLTFRDYLNNFDGSAYGIKQKMGQLNLIGQLPIRNLYAAGQSSLLPGVLGAMLSSFIVAQKLIDRETYMNFLGRNL